MNSKTTLALFLGLVAVTAASAHFAYIVPSADGSGVQVIFSDSLEPDMNVPITKIAQTTLFVVDETGKRTPLKVTKGEHALTAEVANRKGMVVGGVTNYGFHQSKHTENKPVWLRYYPKAILGDASAARLGDAVPLEIVPVISEGKVRFQALLKGKPLATAKFAVLEPGAAKGQRTSAETDGLSKVAFEKPGRYGVWTSYIEPTAGELGGKKYEEIRHFATLVLEFKPTAAAGAK